MINMGAPIEIELKNLPEESIVLVVTKAESAFESGLAIVKFFTQKGEGGIILSASRPFSNLRDIYRKNAIDSKKLFVLDCVSKNEGVSVQTDKNVIFLENASDLTQISISINTLIKSNKNIKFILIDSITTMLIHNKPDILARFIHSILTRMRIAQISCFSISLENEVNREVQAEIAQLCDKVLNIQ